MEPVTSRPPADEDPVGQIYEAHAARVERYLRRLVQDQHEAEDLTQQVFLKLFTVLQQYEPREGASFGTWLMRVAHNVAVDHMRSPRAVPTGMPSGEADSIDDAGTDHSRSLHEALAALPEVQRRVVMLRHIAGFTPPEIAIVIGRTQASVSGLHNRGRGTLMRELIERQAAPCTRGIGRIAA